MLSPVINSAEGLLTQALQEIMLLDKYSTTANNIMIGKLEKDPDWLSSVRSRTRMLGEAGASWMLEKPDIWAPILLQFTDYATSFSSIAAMQKNGNITTSVQWVELLSNVLLNQLATAAAATTAADVKLKTEYEKFSDVQPLLEESINEGWVALAGEEQQMINIAVALTHLQDTVESLEDSITSGMISSGQSIITTSVKTIYGIATAAGASFSFLSMATSAFTVGKMYYDIISKTEEVGKTLEKIAALQLEASEEAQAAAGTKMILQLLYNLEKSFLSIRDVVPQIATMWQTEHDKVQSVIEAINGGVNPSDYFEISSIPTANANWQEINTFATTIPGLKEIIGTPVILDPFNPVATSN